MSKASQAFAKKEEEIISFWEKNKIFEQTQIEGKDYTFYDGPPFCTGQPHHGHLLCSVLKDINGRFQTMKGHRITRKWGWDTHGIPIEQLVMKNLNLKTNEDILKFGIDKFNNEARKIVMECKDDWRYTIQRLGRWVDYENDYKTMDLEYMNSVWWAFKMLWDKGLIYRGVKVMPYSNACNTALSNFEAKLNYKEREDPSIYVKIGEFLIWTTTPWTLPANLAICVNPEMDYVKTEQFIVGKFFADKNNLSYTEVFKGSALLGLSYEPLWSEYKDKYPNSHRIIADTYVTAESGTGLVHIAPTFGEDDYRVCMKYSIISKELLPPCPLDENGIYTEFQMKGKYCLDCNKWIIKILGEKVWKVEKYIHNYPYCWRTDTPLIYRAVDSWFVNVEKIKDRLIEENKKITWIPENVGTGRFGSWLSEARDWCISRNRYWGTPLPVWISEDNEVLVFGSKDELSLATNLEITDLHRDFIDHLEVKKNGKIFRRIDPVLDCWFESGSMPFASQGLRSTPPQADFIAEGIDQCRGWFYTLLVLGVALFDQSPYKTVKVSGLLLGSDGEKMSKSKKNYTEVNTLLEKYSSDAVRLYLASLPASHGGSSAFEDKRLTEITANVSLPIYNAIKFVKLMQTELGESSTVDPHYTEIDSWIIQKTLQFYEDCHQHYENGEYHFIQGELTKMVDLFSRWYIKLVKTKASAIYNKNIPEVQGKIITLISVLRAIAVSIAPICPFLAEAINLEFTQESIHLQKFEIILPGIDISSNLDTMIEIINQIRFIRGKEGIAHKQPLTDVVITSPKMSEYTCEILENEINCLNVRYLEDENIEIKYSTELTPEANKVYITKNLAREIQAFRKDLGLIPTDKIEVGFIGVPNEFISEELLTEIIHSEYASKEIEGSEKKEIDLLGSYQVKLWIKRV
jgi:isoleucyl-tRNA synthetase